MIYLRNPQNNEIAKFESWAAVGAGFKDWTEASAAEISAMELEKAKAKKIAELENYYNSSECWMFKVKSTALSASLTRDAEWFGRMLPAIDGQFPLFTDSGAIIVATITQTKARKINSKIQLEMSLLVRTKYNDCKILINNAATIEAISAINPKTLLGEVPRVVEIDDIA